MNTNFMVKRIAWMIVEVRLSSVLRWRDEYGTDYDDVTFASLDGITLDGRYMSTKNPFKNFFTYNHFLPANRYGFPGHLKDWRCSITCCPRHFLRVLL